MYLEYSKPKKSIVHNESTIFCIGMMTCYLSRQRWQESIIWPCCKWDRIVNMFRRSAFFPPSASPIKKDRAAAASGCVFLRRLLCPASRLRQLRFPSSNWSKGWNLHTSVCGNFIARAYRLNLRVFLSKTKLSKWLWQRAELQWPCPSVHFSEGVKNDFVSLNL